MGGMGGMPGNMNMGGMGGGMGGGGMDPAGMLSGDNMDRMKTIPKFAPWFQDVQFANKFEMCKTNPMAILQLAQQDPRFMDIFGELTGVNMGAMREDKMKDDADLEKKMEDRAAEDAKRAEADEIARKAAEEATLPNEEKIELQKKKDAEAKKLEGNAAYKAKDFPNAIRFYSEAIDLNPKEFTFYTNMAAVYVEMKEYDSAIEQCDKVIELSKEGGYDYVKLGKAMARKASALFH